MDEIQLPKGARVWPVLSKPDSPDRRFPAKVDVLDRDIVIPSDMIFRVPKTPRFRFFQDGEVVISGHPYAAGRTDKIITNPDGMYAYVEFAAPKKDAKGNIAHGFIFNIHRTMKKQPDKWELEPYFVSKQLPVEKEIEPEEDEWADLPF